MFSATRFTRMTLAAAMLCLAPGPTAAAQAQADRPPFRMLAHWSFDAAEGDAALIRDLGPHKLHGRLHIKSGDAVKRVPGVRGEALQFPRRHESWVELPEAPQWQAPAPFTIAVWVKLEPLSREQMEIFNRKLDSWRRGYRFAVSLRRISFEYSDGRDNIRVQAVAPPLRAGQWSFVACVRDRDAIRLYADGELLHEQPAKRNWARTDGAAAIGNYLGTAKNQYYYAGLMDELMFVREALSSEQLARLGLWSRRPADQ